MIQKFFSRPNPEFQSECDGRRTGTHYPENPAQPPIGRGFLWGTRVLGDETAPVTLNRGQHVEIFKSRRTADASRENC